MDEGFEIRINKDMEGKRIDSFIASNTEGLTRNFIQRLIEGGSISVKGKVSINKNYKLHTGDVILIDIPEEKSIEVLPEDIPLNIVYEDDDILVVDKKKGMVVHPSIGNENGTLVNAALYHCKSLSTINGLIRPGIVHRIDKDTSGLLVLAKNDETYLGLSGQFRDHSITREYRAIVYGNIKENLGRIDAPIGRNPKNRFLRTVTDEKHGRRAITNYQVMGRTGKFTYVACRLETGRTHQIRVHMTYIKHPLLGDRLYGPSRSISGINSQVLHANLLGFIHPKSDKYLEFESPLPDSFLKAMDKVGL